MTNRKVLPVALVAALLGGTVGAFVMRPGKTTDAAVNGSVPTAATQSNLDNGSAVNDQVLPVASKNEVAANGENNLTPDERDAYRDGFTDGVKALRENGTKTVDATRYAAQPTAATSRVASRTATRTRYASSGSNGQRRVYYDYSQPRQRSFWQKHRDKLTLAAGTGGGALLGSLIGGKKGAAIGAIAGGGGSALYTYKLRKRNRRY